MKLNFSKIINKLKRKVFPNALSVILVGSIVYTTVSAVDVPKELPSKVVSEIKAEYTKHKVLDAPYEKTINDSNNKPQIVVYNRVALENKFKYDPMYKEYARLRMIFQETKDINLDIYKEIVKKCREKPNFVEKYGEKIEFIDFFEKLSVYYEVDKKTACNIFIGLTDCEKLLSSLKESVNNSKADLLPTLAITIVIGGVSSLASCFINFFTYFRCNKRIKKLKSSNKEIEQYLKTQYDYPLTKDAIRESMVDENKKIYLIKEFEKIKKISLILGIVGVGMLGILGTGAFVYSKKSFNNRQKPNLLMNRVAVLENIYKIRNENLDGIGEKLLVADYNLGICELIKIDD
ncbi:hypothetical protein FACS189465_0190 [Clostridia bacterium]|nr:hypothetical protein FACS189465_0190 [Clostridia bacterium]